VHPQVKKLIELQKVDLEIASLTKDIDSLPVEEQKRRRRLDELERVLAERKTAVNKADLDSRALDKAVRGNDEAIKKLNERLNVVRNNAEYQALLFQIEAVRKDRDVTQEECLKLLEAIEAQRPGVAEAQAAVDAERKVFEGFLAEAELLRSSRAGAIAAVRERRKAMAEGVSADLLVEYDGLFKTRDRLAVCEVVDAYCHGCYNKITPNDVARLRGGTTVVRCGSCQRLLYHAG
jgi:predicted  nucleic acid-binding Zn-ribbon protein